MTDKPESSNFNKLWMPDQVRHDGVGTFYEAVIVKFITFYEAVKLSTRILKYDYV